MKRTAILALSTLSLLGCGAKAERSPPREETDRATSAVVAAPALTAMNTTAVDLGRPGPRDAANVDLLFGYSAGASPITQVTIVATDPSGREEAISLQGLARYGVRGASGTGRYRLVFNNTSPIGKYIYRVVLRDATGATSVSGGLYASVTVADTMPGPVALTGFTPTTARPGDRVTLSGTGFDGRAAANVVTFGGARATIVGVGGTWLQCTLPAGALSGAVVVQNIRGLATAPSDLRVTPTLAVRPPERSTLPPLATTRLVAEVTGVARPTVAWRVNGIAGGRSDLGVIDAAGTYTAPAVPPAAGYVDITAAVTAAEPPMYAATRLQLVSPLPVTGVAALNRATGGTFNDRNNLASVSIAPGASDRNVTLAPIDAALLDPTRPIANLPDAMPLARVRLYVRTITLARLLGGATARVSLPRRLPAGTELQVHRETTGAPVYLGVTTVNPDGISAIARLDGWGSFVVSARYPSLSVDFAPSGMPLTSVGVAAVSGPMTGIEEGATVPVLVEGANFWPGYTRVTVSRLMVSRGGAAPVAISINPRSDLDGVSQDKNPVVGPVLINAARTRLGFTLRVPDMVELLAGDQLLVGLRIERLSLGGRASFGTVETDPARLVVRGLPELLVTAPAAPTLLTVDGGRIDATVAASTRYSTVEIAAGTTVGIGSPVGTVTLGGAASQQSVDLSTLGRFEQAFGPLAAIPAGVSRTTTRVFQPARDPVAIESTGPVDVRGQIYLAGMHGGENPVIAQAAGVGRPGGLAGGRRSAGNGGNGGVTDASNQTQHGRPAGNDFAADGVGTSAASGTLNVPVAARGTRFDPVVRDAFDLGLIGVVGPIIVSAVFAPPASLGAALGAVGELAGAALSSSNTVAVSASSAVFGGSGGHGGRRASGLSAELVNDAALFAGTGGGGGGGGGSSSFIETLFGVTLTTENRTGGAGGGGGGAAGALRITGGDLVDLRGSILGTGGRGGVGEPHHWLASPGGGGGGGAGAVIKVQGVRLVQRGVIDASGGERGGSVQLSSRAAGQFPGPGTRLQVVDTQGGHGGLLFYSSGGTGKDVTMAFPTGRVRAMPRMFPVAPAWTQALAPAARAAAQNVRAVGNANLGGLRGILVVDGGNHLHFMGLPDYDAGVLGTLDIDLVDLNASMRGLTVVDVAQSPVAPHNIYVAGLVGAAGTTAEIHELDVGGTYLRRVLQVQVLSTWGAVPALGDIEVLSDGRRLAALMTTDGGSGSGVHYIDIATGARSLGLHQNSDTRSLSVLRGATRDELMLGGGGTCEGCQGWLERADLGGTPTTQRSFVVETLGYAGDPGLVRVDGALVGGNAPTLRYDGEALRGQRYNSLPSTYAAPTVGSFGAPATGALTTESLVVVDPDVTAFTQGAAPSSAEQMGMYCTQTTSMVGVPCGPVGPVDSQGRAQATVRLAPGFTSVWVQTSTGGQSSALLRRTLLLL